MTNYTGGMNQVLDTYQAVKELVSSGFAEGQAEAIVSLQMRFLNENVATKQDIALIQRDIETQRLATQKDIESLRAETKKDIEIIHKDIESLRAETQQSFAAVHKDIESLRAETKKDIEIIHKDIESLRAETQQSFVAVHKDIESLKAETKKDMQLQSSQLTVRMGGMLMATVGVLVGLQALAGIFAG